MNSCSVGVLGGMGPLATMEFLERILAPFRGLPDRKYPRIVVDFQTQLPSRTRFAVTGSDSPAPGLLVALDGLVSLGCSPIVVPCNSADSVLFSVGAKLPDEYLSIVRVTTEAALERADEETRSARVALIAGRATVVLGAYDEAFRGYEHVLVKPSTALQTQAEEIIEQVKHSGFGTHITSVRDLVRHVLVDCNADIAMLACTELDLPDDSIDGKAIVSSTRALAEEVSRLCGATR